MGRSGHLGLTHDNGKRAARFAFFVYTHISTRALKRSVLKIFSRHFALKKRARKKTTKKYSDD